MLKIENYFEGFLLLFLLGLFFYLIKGFILPLLFASALVFLSYKLFLKLDKKINNRTYSSLIVFFIVMFLILIPGYMLLVSLVKETTGVINTGQVLFENGALLSCESSFCNIANNFFEKADISLEVIIRMIGDYIKNSVSYIVGSISKLFLDIFVFSLAFFFFLRDGDKFAIYIKRIIPMKNEYKNALFIRFREVSLAVFVNTLLVALLQGSLVGIGFWIVGFESAIFWGVIASFCALLPLFGPSLVWGPAALYLALSGDSFSAVVLSLYGLLVVSVSDNLLRPFLLKGKIHVHQFLILLSILGGIEAFGFFMGIFLGPMIISFLVSVLHLYNLEFN